MRLGKGHFAYLSSMRYLLILMALALSTASFAQKKTQIEFEVRGVCGMCETRIEKALDAPGIIMAQWDAETQKAMVAYKTKVITEDEIHQLVAKVGHDTDKKKATDEAYANLHGCCKYRGEGGESCSDKESKDDVPRPQ